jgi:tetratricopeptide (TPR) repeat protein
MSNSDIITTIGDLLIRNPYRIVFFLGAGCSQSAGIPTAGEISRTLATRLFLKQNNKQPPSSDKELEEWLEEQAWFNQDNQYPSILDRSFPNNKERRIYFEELISGKQPSASHIGLASIIRSGLSSIVLTPNFDRLIEYAIIRIGHIVPTVSLFDADLPYLDLETSRKKVLKLHGDYLYGNIRNLGRELSTVESSMRVKLEKSSFRRGIVVCGYSGGDDTIMSSFENLAQDENNYELGIHWLILGGTRPSERVVRLIEQTRDRGSKIYEIEGSDWFFSELSRYVVEQSSTHCHFALERDAHIATLDKGKISRLAAKCLGKEYATEFVNLLYRDNLIQEMVDSPLSLDYVLARFDELGELPTNVGEAVNRYLDYLFNGWLPQFNSENTYIDLKKQCVRLAFKSGIKNLGGKLKTRSSIYSGTQSWDSLEHSGIIRRTEKDWHFRNSAFLFYFQALGLNDEHIENSLVEILVSGEKFPILCYYVGLVEDATKVIVQAADCKMNDTQQSLTGPWPKEYYRGARLVGRAQYVDPGVVSNIADRLLLEFDKEKYPPYNAVKALASMKGAVIEKLLTYLGDVQQDTFSREDAALALGAMGKRRVVDCLEQCLRDWPARQKKMAVYALGLTANPRAVKAIKRYWKEIPADATGVVTDALKKLGCNDSPPVPKTQAGQNHVVGINPNEVMREVLGQEAFSVESQNLQKLLLKAFHEGVLSSDLPFAISPEAKRLITAGNQLRISGQPDKAEVVLKEAIERYPMIVEAYHDLALLYSNQNRLQNAQRYYELGLRYNPKYADYYNDFGVLLMKRQNLSGARMLLQIASKIDPKSHRPWINLGSINIQEGRMEDGYRCFKIVLKLNPSHENVRQRLDVLEKELSPSVLERLADETETNLNIDLLWAEQSTAKSSTFEEVTRSNLSTIWADAQSRCAEGDLVGSFSVLETLHKLIPANIDVLHNMAVVKENLGKTTTAIKIYNKILQLDPKNHDAHANLSNIYFNEGNIVEAKNHASKAIIANPNSPLAKYLLARALHAQGDDVESNTLLREALLVARPMSGIEFQIRSLLSKIEKERS